MFRTRAGSPSLTKGILEGLLVHRAFFSLKNSQIQRTQHHMRAAEKAKRGTRIRRNCFCLSWRFDAVGRRRVTCFVPAMDSCAYFAGAPEFIWPEERASNAVQARLAGAPNAYHTDPVPGITSNVT